MRHALSTLVVLALTLTACPKEPKPNDDAAAACPVCPVCEDEETTGATEPGDGDGDPKPGTPK